MLHDRVDFKKGSLSWINSQSDDPWQGTGIHLKREIKSVRDPIWVFETTLLVGDEAFHVREDVSIRKLKWSLADSQPEHRHLSPVAARNWILPPIGMSLEADSSPELPKNTRHDWQQLWDLKWRSQSGQRPNTWHTELCIINEYYLSL